VVQQRIDTLDRQHPVNGNVRPIEGLVPQPHCPDREFIEVQEVCHVLAEFDKDIEESTDVVYERVLVPSCRLPGLRRLLNRLLSMEAEDTVDERGFIKHGPQRLRVAFGHFQQGARVVRADHRPPPPES